MNVCLINAGGGIGLGGGGMLPSVKNVPLGYGPLTSIGHAFKRLYTLVETSEQWRIALKKNGLPIKALKQKQLIHF